MTYSFIALPEVLLEFFERVKELKEDTEEERLKILCDMIKEGYKISVMKTGRTKEQVIQDYAKHGDVLYVKSPDDLTGGDMEDDTYEEGAYENVDPLPGLESIDYEEGYATGRDVGYEEGSADAWKEYNEELELLQRRNDELAAKVVDVTALAVKIENLSTELATMLYMKRY